MMIEIDANTLIGSLNRFTDSDIFKKTMKEVADKAYEYCTQHYVPVDTGALRRSIKKKVTETGYALTAGNEEVDYAHFNEFGESPYTPAGSVKHPKPAKKHGFRPFLRPSIYKANREYPKLFGKKFVRIFRG